MYLSLFFTTYIGKMNNAKHLEISHSNFIPVNSKEHLKVSVVSNNTEYNNFFQSYLLLNKPCIIDNVSKVWNCNDKWIKSKSLNVKYFKNNLPNVDVPVANCGKREFNVQKKCTMKLYDYLDYWEAYKKLDTELDCLYLKDWHYVKEFPHEVAYRVPFYFASDWLNEYYDNNSELNDDFRFTYIGPKGSWTPFHVDVFTSYSWSVNICGRKKWILVPPGEENCFKDEMGNVLYDISLIKGNSKSDDKTFLKPSVIEVIQEEGEGLFIPSGWYHQVWNLDDTVSINHNWINGCNINYVYESMKKSLSEVKKEISDCKDMDGWALQCQLILSSLFGFNYEFFYSFLINIAKRRIDALKTSGNLLVSGNWILCENHLKFDLKQVLSVLKLLQMDDDFLELVNKEKKINHCLEFIDSLNNFFSTR